VNIIVCVKQIPDPETPASSFRVDEAAKKVVPAQGIAPVVNPYDPQATEAALRLRDADGGGKVTVISLGPDSARDAIKHALAMGADEGILLNDPAFADVDNFQTARALAKAIQKVGEFDLILMGRAAADWDMGVVPTGVSQILGLPVVTVAKAIDDVFVVEEASDLKVFPLEKVRSGGFVVDGEIVVLGTDGPTGAMAYERGNLDVRTYDKSSRIVTGSDQAQWAVSDDALVSKEGQRLERLAGHRGVKVERVLDDGFQTVEAPLPAVVSISNEFGEPRYPQLRQIMLAAKKTVQVWSAADLGIGADETGAASRAMPLEALYVPKVESNVEIIEGDSPEEKARNLAQKLRAAKLV
jgi:electron transfer flavoprotein alpha/beta subunit